VIEGVLAEFNPSAEQHLGRDNNNNKHRMTSSKTNVSEVRGIPHTSPHSNDSVYGHANLTYTQGIACLASCPTGCLATPR
jgi:hypothetical protein